VVESLKERLARAVPGIRQCAMLDARRDSAGPAAGTLELRVTIAPTGAVTELDLGGSELSRELQRCISAAVKRVPFAPFEGTAVTLQRQVALAPR
jgi:hypothetical protein